MTRPTCAVWRADGPVQLDLGAYLREQLHPDLELNGRRLDPDRIAAKLGGDVYDEDELTNVITDMLLHDRDIYAD